MVPDIAHLIAAICPEVFCQAKARAAVKYLLEQSLAAGDRMAYLKAAAKAQPCDPNLIPLEQLMRQSVFELPGQRSPIEQHSLVFEHADETLEALYFGLLDELQRREDWRVTKLVDTVVGTRGSALGADLFGRTTQQQEQAAKLMSQIHSRSRALLKLWQKWREEKRMLDPYDDARFGTGTKKESALHSLRNRWRTTGGPEGAPSDEGASDTDFQAWVERSQAELRLRLEINRRALASELSLLKIQAAWLKPYLHHFQHAQRLGEPALVTAFNTAIFELILLVEVASDLKLAVQRGDLPKMLLNPKHRRPSPVLMVELRLRAVPERIAGGSYVHRGRAEVVLRSYALNSQELAVLRREVERGEYGELLGELTEQSSETLHELLSDLDELLAEKEVQPAQAKPLSEDINPFSALFSILRGWSSSSEPADKGAVCEPLRPDSEIEGVLRSWALLEARQACLEFYEHEKERLQMVN